VWQIKKLVKKLAEIMIYCFKRSLIAPGFVKRLLSCFISPRFESPDVPPVRSLTNLIEYIKGRMNIIMKKIILTIFHILACL